MRALFGLLEYKDHLPPDSGESIREIFALTYGCESRRHYWWNLIAHAIPDIMIETFFGNGLMMSPTTFRKWLRGEDIASHHWPLVM